MVESKKTAYGSLRLVFSTSGENALNDFARDAYELCLMDGAGAPVMHFIVPADIVESVVFSQAEILVSMALDGEIAAFLADADVNIGLNNSITVDALVERAVTPQMLEDEPDANRMLRTLRNRLRSAIKFVEEAIDRTFGQEG